MQRIAARFVTNTPYRYDQPDSMTAIIRDLKWESLESRRKKASLTMLYKIVNHTVQFPQEYHPTSDTSKYNTRSSNNSRRFTKSDTPQFRGGNPYFFSENPYQSVSFIDASMYRENVHAIHIAMQFAKKSRHCVIKIDSQQQRTKIGALFHVARQSD